MLKSIKILGFRGIATGELTDLAPLTVFIGPNGCGKSTVIEAAFIGISPRTDEAIAQVVRRHEGGQTSPLWLLWRMGESSSAEITVKLDNGDVRVCQLERDWGVSWPTTQIKFTVFDGGGSRGNAYLTFVQNKLVQQTSLNFHALDDVRDVRLIEGYYRHEQRPLHTAYTEAVRSGHRQEALAYIGEVLPGLANVEILIEGETPILHLVLEDGSIPVTLVGDGIQSLLQFSLQLAAAGPGLALLEEPEVHQHPSAIRQTAKVIWAAVRRGLQVMLTTHSLELIDALLAEAKNADIEKLSLYQLRLDKGALLSHRRSGPDVAFARGEVERDLR